ncbi:cell division protein ZapD [Cupriavidus gilardii]|uniref:cell division protein ZapD n=1 Tax=Cupriavidus gilardii TaxID=82541 RepID=UPI001572925A|nr:cell division protein ZapD [Cupriavidus gilardii]MBO4121697.1 cell division protein ZapD [Cupriavidus gilardii]MCG5263082.1 cell division protein ZapD [Cupriavidus gilardii]MDF9432029.1 cell division protein ZapD [Cupriavidus gilardii]NSX02499.1 cell division protein ZapD [Cupriavidus gilardii]
MILYEYPFNERIRTLLRLEDLFDRLEYFLGQEHALQHHVALTTLFEIIDVAGRADLKTDLIKELDRQRQALTALRSSPQIDQQTLDAVIGELEQAISQLNQTVGKAGQLLTDNEWLTSIRSRAIIPGGTCEFDLPSYYAWQHRPAEERRADILKWVRPLIPLRVGTDAVLKLLRESGQSGKVIATGGSYQQMLSGRSYQLMQVLLDDSLLAFIPEMSANKYMLWVRFTQQDGDMRPRSVDADIPFLLKLCNF